MIQGKEKTKEEKNGKNFPQLMPFACAHVNTLAQVTKLIIFSMTIYFYHEDWHCVFFSPSCTDDAQAITLMERQQSDVKPRFNISYWLLHL